MAEEKLRELNLLGATGTARTVVESGREWLVIPTVALMEGVIHPVNAATPEFVSAAVLEKAATTWNGKPITLGHPTKAGKQCSANDPEIHASHGIGEVRNARYENKKLLCDSWIDVARAGKLHPKMLARLQANEREEVSVGAFVFTDDVASEFNGKPYKAAWLETKGDHLAFLPGGRGACSCEMGCGTHRAAAMRVCGDHLELETLGDVRSAGIFASTPDMKKLQSFGIETFTTLADQSLDERIRAVNDAVSKKWNTGSDIVSAAPSYAYAKQVFDNSVIVEYGPKLYAVPYDVAEDGTVTLGAETEVKQAYVAAAMKTQSCETCDGTGQVKAGDHQKDCPMCEGKGTLKAAAGARHSASDSKMVQAVHDHAVALGADCDPKNYKMLSVKIDGKKLAGIIPTEDGVLELESKIIAAAITPPTLKAACACQEGRGESTMTKEQKAELIAALTTDKYSGFKDTDVTFLESAPDARLEEFKAAAAANKTAAEAAAKNENELRAANAKITVIEGRLKAAEATPTTEEWLAKAPPEMKALLENQRIAEAEKREALVRELKTAGANTEEELKAMPTDQLETLAKYAKVKAPDFSGRGMPVSRAASAEEDYTPPDSYGPALKSLREAQGSKAVN